MIARKDTHLSLISVVFLFCIALLPIQLQAKPSVEALMAKGDSCRHIWQYNKALGFFQQAYDDPSVVGNPHLQMQLLERIMRTHYVLCHWKELPEPSVNIGTLSEVYVIKTVDVGSSVTDYYTRDNDGNFVEATGVAEEGKTYYEKKTVLGADIRGNVYGGGNNAEVTGNTNVTIGKEKPAP